MLAPKYIYDFTCGCSGDVFAEATKKYNRNVLDYMVKNNLLSESRLFLNEKGYNFFEQIRVHLAQMENGVPFEDAPPYRHKINTRFNHTRRWFIGEHNGKKWFSDGYCLFMGETPDGEVKESEVSLLDLLPKERYSETIEPVFWIKKTANELIIFNNAIPFLVEDENEVHYRFPTAINREYYHWGKQLYPNSVLKFGYRTPMKERYKTISDSPHYDYANLELILFETAEEKFLGMVAQMRTFRPKNALKYVLEYNTKNNITFRKKKKCKK